MKYRAVLAVAIALATPVAGAAEDASALVAQAIAQLGSNPKAALRDSDRALRLDPSVKGGQLAHAQALEALGRDADAGAAYRAALAASPDDRTAALGVARTARKTGDSQAALAILNTLLGSGEDHDARFERALVFGRLGQSDKALADYSAVIQAQPSLGALYNRGWILADRKENAKALADFEQAHALRPNDVDTLNSIGSMLIRLDRHEEALVRFDAALAIDGRNAEALFGRADANYNLGRWRAAATAYHARAALPKPLDALVLEAKSLSQAGDSKAAMAAYDRAIRLDRQSTAALTGRAALFEANGDTAKAVADYGRAIAATPTEASFRVQRAFALRTSQPAAARADIDAALKLDPKSTYALNALGLIQHDAAEYDEAIAAFDKALALEPDYEAAYYNRGNAYAAQGRQDRAIRDYNASLRLSPRDPVTLNAKGEAYRQVDDYPRAIEEFDVAIEGDPELALAYWRRAEAREALGDLDAAKSDRARAVELDPDLADS
ncbi:tetratricopeptide repeat protein [Sphingomonas sp. ZT3P38]|uniref:tetratricopeptide repeat protein n=1 Tax=Parasphingomonas zepuensis TaxID=3096161 RepID=UPI002FCAEF66